MQYVSVNTNKDNVLTKNITDVWSVTNEQPSDVNAYGLYVLDGETRKWVGNTPRTIIEVPDENIESIENIIEQKINELSLTSNEYPIIAYGDEDQDFIINTKDRELIDALILLANGDSTYGNRMFNYYPYVLQVITEFKALTKVEGYEVDYMRNNMKTILNNAYLETMGEDRIEQWEQVLSIAPLEGSTLQDRRDTIIARIRGQGKLNTELINTIVRTFTGGTAISWIENSCLYVIVTPPPNNKQYRFENVEQEIAKKIPAHLGFNIKRNYMTWQEVKDGWDTWGDLNDTVASWEDVYLYVPVWG
jgi:hypothetical protein